MHVAARGTTLGTVFVSAVLMLALSACTPTHVDRGSLKPEPSAPAEGQVIDTVEADNTVFTMYDEGDDCVAVEIAHPGLQLTVERACLDQWNTLRETSACGWLAGGPEDPGDCEVELPRVLFGRVAVPGIAYVCVGEFDLNPSGGSHGVVGARLLERDKDGYILTIAEPGERRPAHLLSTAGHRVGEPPLDAPSGPIYAFCEALAGVEQGEELYIVDLAVTFDDELRDRDVTVLFHSGLDRMGVASGAADPGGAMRLPTRVTPTSDSFMIDVEIDGEPTMGLELSWPQAMHDILDSGEPCNGLTSVAVDIGAGVLDGATAAIKVSFGGSDCDANGG